MKVSRSWSLVLSSLLLISLTGCTVYLGGDNANEKYERVVELSESLEPGLKLSAQTSNGAITVAGADVAVCHITATITARSFSVEESQLLAEQTQVRLERTPEGLQTVIERPKKKNQESISVKLDVQTPKQTALSLRTSNGRINVTAIEKELNAKTSNGRIEISDLTGSVTANTSNGRIVIKQTDAEKFDLHTSNGRITCEAITGDMKASTSNGAINIQYAPTASPATNIHLTTSNGSISITTPDNYSAQVDASTSNSKIHTDLPITVQGEFGKKVKGTIGSGKGQLTLKTSNGSINIR